MVESEEFFALAVDDALWRIEVFHIDSFGGRVEYSASESCHSSADGEDGPYHPPSESVAQCPVVILQAESCAQAQSGVLLVDGVGQVLFLISCLEGVLCQGLVGLVGAESQLEACDDIVAEASVVEICHPHGSSHGGVVQLVLKPVLGPVVEDEHAVSVRLRLLLFVGEFSFLDFYSVFLGQVSECVIVAQLLMLHDEVHGTSAHSASEAFAYVLGWRNHEGWGTVIVEGA